MDNSWDSAKRLSTNGAQEFVFRKKIPYDNYHLSFIIYHLGRRPQNNIRLSQYVKDRIFLISLLPIQVIPVVKHPTAVLAAVELAILVDSVVRYAEGGALCTLRADYGITF